MNPYYISLIVSCILSLILTPIVRIIALKLNIVDIPNQRKVHKKPIPRIGGLAIYISFIIGVLLNYRLLNNHLRGFILGSIIIAICGILDDIYSLSYRTKLLFQTIAASVLIYNDIAITAVSLLPTKTSHLYSIGVLSIPLTLLWVIGITNAFNLIDGLDGLACGVSIISSTCLVIIAISTGNAPVALMLCILIGSCLGFLPYNFNPAQIFMGDSGSLFLGFSLAALSIQGTMKYAATLALIIPALVIGLPLYDTITTILRRIRHKQPIMLPDKGHFHHRWLQIGLTHRQVVLLGYLFNTSLGLIAVYISTNSVLSLKFLFSFGILIILFLCLDTILFSNIKKAETIKIEILKRIRN